MNAAALVVAAVVVMLAQAAGWAWQQRSHNAGIVDVIWAGGVGFAAVWLAWWGDGAVLPRATLAVLGGMGLSRLGLAWADPVLALLVAVMVVRIAVQILRQALPTLMDEAAVDGPALAAAARQVPGVRDAYRTRSRRAGAISFAELTISVSGSASVTRGHEVADAVEHALQERFGLREVVVHVEPSEEC